MLTNVCIYWFNANITSSMRLYKEAGADLKELLGLRVMVSGCFCALQWAAVGPGVACYSVAIVSATV